MNAAAPPQPTRRFRALYTKHVRQKNKVYHDGFVLLRASSVLLALTDEAGRTLAVASAPVASRACQTVSKTGRSRWREPPLPGVTPPTIFVPYAIACSE